MNINSIEIHILYSISHFNINICGVTHEYISVPAARLKNICLTTVGIKHTTFGMEPNALPTDLRGQIGSSM